MSACVDLAALPPDERLVECLLAAGVEVGPHRPALRAARRLGALAGLAPGDVRRVGTGVLELVAALASWDRAFRDAGLLAGNVYLASDAAGLDLLAAAGARCRLSAGTLAAVLHDLYGLELIYRFPVALKFRSEYGPDRQFRLNCWGRRLAAQLRADGPVAAGAPAVDAALDGLLARHHDRYARHVALLHEAAEGDGGRSWASAAALPVGVLL
jgi:hypothetical protein